MAERRKPAPKVEVIERVQIVDKASGTFCTVGSNVVDKYISGARAKYALEENYVPVDTESETAEDGKSPAAPKK